ncbi:hypothetical protein BWI93_09750 [Siphonobacter sp. BAB-5385]|nr:hypothetical protein BWI93_09750 [Siphonobacter sp. BAB-5385]
MGTIKLCIQMKGHPDANLSTHIKVSKNDWGGNFKRFLGQTDWAQAKNKQLRTLEVEMEQLQGILRVAGYTLTPRLLATVYPNMVGRQMTIENVKLSAQSDQPKFMSILSLIDWHIKASEREPSTATAYRVRRTNMVRFLESIQRKDMAAEAFDEAMVLKFSDWLRSRVNRNGASISQLHVYKHVIFYRKAMTEAYRRKLLLSNPLERLHIDKEDSEVDLRHLTEEQIEQLEDLDLHLIYDAGTRKRAEHVRDLFIFCCYTGLHHSDRQDLSSKHIKLRKGALWICKKRQKTNIEAKIKLHPRAIEIIEKYGSIDELPKVPLNDNNELLKILDALAGFHMGLSTKIARKTFCYRCLNVWNIDRDTVATMMGLSSTTHIDAYAEIDENRVEQAVSW